MLVRITKSKITSGKQLTLSGSKSETNRLQLLRVLYPNITLENSSNSDDSLVMQKILNDFQASNYNPQPLALNAQSSTNDVQSSRVNLPIYDVHHAGTAMRFLTAFFAQKKGCEIILTGSQRMKERPIRILVEALNALGAEISYLEKEGFPPLKIVGKRILKNKISLEAHISSQYISALLLIAPKLDHGLEITLEGEMTSLPYIQMTLALLNEMGVETTFVRNVITVKPKHKIQNIKFTIESDWSSVSYFYAMVALSDVGTTLELSSFKEKSLQGDSVLIEIYRKFGVETSFKNNQILLRKTQNSKLSTVVLDLRNAPDIAQTIAVTCLGLGLGCELKGLHTLKIKETNRLVALQNELSKLGGKVQITQDCLILESLSNLKNDISIKTYQDHRMAMAFATLGLKTNLSIEDAMVVSKSFPDFWKQVEKLGLVFILNHL